MQALQKSGYLTPQLELSLDDYKVNGGSIGCGRDGTTFAFTIGPLAALTVAALEDAVREHGRICLYCCREPLFFDPVALERKDLRSVRVVGRIVGGAADASRNAVL